MSQIFADRVQESFTTTGTGTISLSGAVVGYQAFGAVMVTGDVCSYAATDGTSWEVGTGTYGSSGDTLARTVILASSNSGSAVNWGAGTKNIWLDAPAAAFAPPAIDILTVGSGTYNIRTGALYVRVRLVGSGGGGGNASSNPSASAAGSGGGAGATNEGTFPASVLGTSQSYTVGAGGTSASNGAQTSFGSLLTAPGGTAGNSGTTSSGYGIVGGAGGVLGTGGNPVVGGDGGGGVCQAFNSNLNMGGQGGSNAFGGGVTGGTSSNGHNAAAPGTGGSGAGANASGQSNTGGIGANGLIIIETFFGG